MVDVLDEEPEAIVHQPRDAQVLRTDEDRDGILHPDLWLDPFGVWLLSPLAHHFEESDTGVELLLLKLDVEHQPLEDLDVAVHTDVEVVPFAHAFKSLLEVLHILEQDSELTLEILLLFPFFIIDVDHEVVFLGGPTRHPIGRLLAPLLCRPAAALAAEARAVEVFLRHFFPCLLAAVVGRTRWADVLLRTLASLSERIFGMLSAVLYAFPIDTLTPVDKGVIHVLSAGLGVLPVVFVGGMVTTHHILDLVGVEHHWRRALDWLLKAVYPGFTTIDRLVRVHTVDYTSAAMKQLVRLAGHLALNAVTGGVETAVDCSMLFKPRRAQLLVLVL